MSWSAVGRFFTSKWMQNQAPAIVMSFLVMVTAGYALLVLIPQQARESDLRHEKVREVDRETWKIIRKDIQDGYDRHRTEFLADQRELRATFSAVHQSDAEKYDKLVEAMLHMRQLQTQTMNFGDGLMDKRVREQLQATGKLPKQETDESAQENSGDDMRGTGGPEGVASGGTGGFASAKE